MNVRAHRQPTELELVLERLAAALDALEPRRIDTRDARAELRALRGQAHVQGMERSVFVPEIDAVAERLTALAAHGVDEHWQLEETAEQAAELLRMLGIEVLRWAIDTHPSAALDFVKRELAGATPSCVEALIGAAPGETAAWHYGGVPSNKAIRVQIVSQMIIDLRRSMRPDAIVGWFSATRDRLDGQTPLEVLDRGDHRDIGRLRRLAQTPHSVLAA